MDNRYYRALASAIYCGAMSANGRTITTDDQRLRASGLYQEWTEMAYGVGDIRNANGQTWECFQAHDPEINPGIVPDDPAWFTFWRPLHGKSPETARPWVKPKHGTTDLYHQGEYMVYTDGAFYRCTAPNGTNFSPEEYPGGWHRE